MLRPNCIKIMLIAALAFFGWTGVGWCVDASSSVGVFRVGVAPHTSARFIIEQYQPVRRALEAVVGMPVEIQTAPDFTEFARRSLNQEYDIAITTGHQARLFQTDAGYLPLVTYGADFTAVAVVPKASKLTAVGDMHGQPVLGLSPTSLVTLWGQHWLVDGGVTDAKIRYVSAADSMAQSLLAGEAVAGFMSFANFDNLVPEVKSQLKILASSQPMLGRVYMLNGHQAPLQAKIAQALFAFVSSPDGKQYFEATKLGGYRLVKPEELESMSAFADEVRKTLTKTGQ